MRVIDLAAVVRMIPVQPDLSPDRADRRRPAGADGPALPSPRSRPDARTGAGVSAKSFPGYALPWAHGIYTG